MKAQVEDSLKVDLKQINDSLNFLLDPVPVDDIGLAVSDSLKNDTISQMEVNFNYKPFKPNPTKAVIYSAIFPGLGQIYNRKYWKLPIVYGGFLGLIYAISWNGRYYNDYTDAYNAIVSDNPFGQENLDVWLPFTGYTDSNNISVSQLSSLQNAFKNKKDSYRRYRDLSIIGTVALYAVCMIDAYVDAQLFDFDISPDLSFRVEPALLNTYPTGYNRALGVQCSLTF